MISHQFKKKKWNSPSARSIFFLKLIRNHSFWLIFSLKKITSLTRHCILTFNRYYRILRQITNLNKHWYFLTTMLLFFLTALGRLRKITALPLSITQSRCLNDRIEVLEVMGSFPGRSTTPLVVKSGTKQTWWKVGFF